VLLKKGYHGTHHKCPRITTKRCADEFSYRHNERPGDTFDQMAGLVRRMGGRRLTDEPPGRPRPSRPQEAGGGRRTSRRSCSL